MSMEVILLERIEKLGQMGDVVRVKPGFARNFLLPQRKALRATKANLEYFETQRVELEAANLKQRQEAEDIAGRMSGLSLVLIRQAGESGHLYGSVSARDIADAITEAGFHVERIQVQMAHPIKFLGIHIEQVALHPEVLVDVTLNVAQSEQEAEVQAERGGSVAQLAERTQSETPPAAPVAAPAANEEQGESGDDVSVAGAEPEAMPDATPEGGDSDAEEEATAG